MVTYDTVVKYRLVAVLWSEVVLWLPHHSYPLELMSQPHHFPPPLFALHG